MPFENKFFSLLFSLLIYSLLLFGFTQHSACSHKIDRATKEILVSLEFVNIEQQHPQSLEALPKQLYEEKVENYKIDKTVEKTETPKQRVLKVKNFKTAQGEKESTIDEAAGGMNSLNQAIQHIEALQETVQSDEIDYEHIRGLVKEHLKYPVSARRLEKEGVAEISFVLSEAGAKEIVVTKSSGHLTLDKAAVSAVYDALSAFKNIKREIMVTIPIVFELN